MEKLTQEQLEMKQAAEVKAEQEERAALEAAENKKIREKLAYDIQMGKDLAALKKNPAFKAVFLGVFLGNGKAILWENIKHLTEEQMKGKGNDRNLEVIRALEGQVKTRLDFEGFIDTVENDYNNAAEELIALNAEAEAANAEGEPDGN